MKTSLGWLKPLHLVCLMVCLLGFTACGGDEMTNYQDLLIGSWQLQNGGDLQPFYNDSPFILRDAQIEFNGNGTLETRLLSSRDNKTWITETGTWSVSQSPIRDDLVMNESISIKADNGPFDDDLFISFEDERTFYLQLNELEYQFKKL